MMFGDQHADRNVLIIKVKFVDGFYKDVEHWNFAQLDLVDHIPGCKNS